MTTVYIPFSYTDKSREIALQNWLKELANEELGCWAWVSGTGHMELDFKHIEHALICKLRFGGNIPPIYTRKYK